MELGLEQTEDEFSFTDYKGFYPCFNGIRVGTCTS